MLSSDGDRKSLQYAYECMRYMHDQACVDWIVMLVAPIHEQNVVDHDVYYGLAAEIILPYSWASRK